MNKLKTQRSEEIKHKYFELELDKAVLIAKGDQKGIDKIEKELSELELAYNAVSGIYWDGKKHNYSLVPEPEQKEES